MTSFGDYRQLSKNRPVEDIAADFGVSPLTVQRRLKLANVSPRLMADYRAGAVMLEQLMALTITDDHTAYAPGLSSNAVQQVCRVRFQRSRQNRPVAAFDQTATGRARNGLARDTATGARWRRRNFDEAPPQWRACSTAGNGVTLHFRRPRKTVACMPLALDNRIHATKQL